MCQILKTVFVEISYTRLSQLKNFTSISYHNETNSEHKAEGPHEELGLLWRAIQRSWTQFCSIIIPYTFIHAFLAHLTNLVALPAPRIQLNFYSITSLTVKFGHIAFQVSQKLLPNETNTELQTESRITKCHEKKKKKSYKSPADC